MPKGPRYDEKFKAQAERWFGTVRARLGRLVRRAYSFPKSVERHLDASHLFVVTHNLSLRRSTAS